MSGTVLGMPMPDLGNAPGTNQAKNTKTPGPIGPGVPSSRAVKSARLGPLNSLRICAAPIDRDVGSLLPDRPRALHVNIIIFECMSSTPMEGIGPC